MQTYVEAEYSLAERAVLDRHFTSIDGPVAVLTNLPDATRAALFARYSRTAKPLKRVFLDEFSDGAEDPGAGLDVGAAKASDLFSRVLSDYGDDSVAQLAGVHVSCEQVSNLLTKVLERGRLMGYLEQSTRYVFYGDQPGGRYRYYRDPELFGGPLAGRVELALDGLFEAYRGVFDAVRQVLDRDIPPDDAAARRATRAAALDVARGLLPAATASNVGMFGSPQAYEALILRMRSHELPEARTYAELLLDELKKVIPDFLTRLDRPERGGAWVDYRRERSQALAAAAAEMDHDAIEAEGPGDRGAAAAGWGQGVRLLRWDADAEDDIVANALFPHTDRPLDDLREQVAGLSEERRAELFRAAVGARRNRRHHPGREWEAAEYEFEVVSDYGAFRDLQRHRLLTVEWQPLGCALGFSVPAEAEAAGVGDVWRAAVERAEAAAEDVAAEYGQARASYLVTMGHRMRYLMRMNAREAMHLVELRSSPQGHSSYRRVAQQMHALIRDVAGHRLIADAMQFVNQDDVHLGRLEAEQRLEGRRQPSG
ncbi:MAG: FAD-dependent thymidylate synthase [Candidatus Dormibacteria bacterium]